LIILLAFCFPLISCEGDIALVVGGWNKPVHGGQEKYLSSVELFDLGVDCYQQMPDLPFGLKGMVGGYIVGMAVVCGGEDSEGFIHSSCYFFDIYLNEWIPYGDLEEGRSFAGATVVEGCLFISGGNTLDGPTGTVEMLGDGCEFLQIEAAMLALTAPKYGHCFVSTGTGFLTVGGSPGNYGSTQVWSQEGGWVEGSSPQKSRDGHDCVLVTTDEGEVGVLVAGNSFSPADLPEIYFPHNDTWVWTSWMDTERAGGKFADFQERPTILGGYGGDYWDKQFFRTGEYYEVRGDYWRTRTSRNLTEGRKNPAVFTVPREILLSC